MAGYQSRMMRDRVSRHTMAWFTRDVHEATVYMQAWEHLDTGARTEFWVLAFPEDAEQHGAIRLSYLPGADLGQVARMRLMKNEANIHATNDAKRSIVETENEYEAECRRLSWQHASAPRHDEDLGDACGCAQCRSVRLSACRVVPDPILREMQAADDRESARNLADLRREGYLP